MVSSKEELKNLIDSVPYPENIDFKPLPENEKESIYKNKNKEFRKQSKPASTQESLEDKKERLLKEKIYRQEKYKKMKEMRKK